MEDFYPPYDEVNEDSDGKHSTNCSPSEVEDLRPAMDLSCEMRLDSLHFDSLSFDPEDF